MNPNNPTIREMKTYEQERDEAAIKYCGEGNITQILAFKMGCMWESDHAQARIAESDRTIEEYQRKNLLICDMLDKERELSANLQSKLEAAEAENNTRIETHANLIMSSIPLADVKPLIEALNLLEDAGRGYVATEALQAFREKYKGVV